MHLAAKSIVIGALTLLFVIVLHMIYNMVQDRQLRQTHVEQNIADSAAGPQTIITPLIALQFRERFTATQVDNGKTVEVQQERDRVVLLGPQTLTMSAEVAVNQKKRGIFSAQLYNANQRFSGEFTIPAQWGLSPDAREIHSARAILLLGVSDMRGVAGIPRVEWGTETRTVMPGTGVAALGDGFHIALDTLPGTAITLRFSIIMDLIGTSRLMYLPTGKDMSVSIASRWQHPSFIGRALPRPKADPSEPAFPAQWRVSHLTHNGVAKLQGLVDAPARQANASMLGQHIMVAGEGVTFGVAFIDPVNIYLQSERAVKYGILFIALTFAAFFFFEVLRQLRIHAIQYGMVGMAIALFFLLLLSLSEHIGFALAYVAAAVACTLLIGFYLAHVLASVSLAAAFTAGLGLLYAALYGLLQSEDVALLLGSALLFGLLALTMVATRKVDWYAVTQRVKVPAVTTPR
jgi:inner membrane protein